MTRKRKTALDYALEEIELTDRQFLSVIRFFERNGLDFGWIPRKGFRFMLWNTGVEDYPVLTHWCGVAVVRDYLDAPQMVFEEFERMIGKLRAHAATCG